jgi:multiple sugar transport system permease protein
MTNRTDIQPAARARVAAHTGTTIQAERAREARAAYLFLLPTFLGFFVFILGPLLASIYISMTVYDVLTPPRWAGFANYTALLSDGKVRASFANTAIFVVLSVFAEIVIALLLAVGVQRRMPIGLRYFLRTAYFLPIVTSGTAVAIVFGYMFNPDFGVINYYLERWGFSPVPWITSTRYSLLAVVLAATWQRLAFTFIVFTAGLQNIPRELYEAAEIDGASGWPTLWRITVPLLSPTILFALVIGIIGSLQVFELPLLMTNGGPGDSSRTVVMVILEEGFRNLQFGYASAIAVVLFVCIMLLTLLQFWLSRRWVHYQ